MPMLDERVLAGARIAPRATALHDGERTTTWRELDALTAERASELARAGIARGDRVAIAGANSIETVVALLAILRAGAVAVPIPADIRPPRLAAILADARPRAIIAPGTILGMAGEPRGLHAIPLGAGFADPPPHREWSEIIPAPPPTNGRTQYPYITAMGMTAFPCNGVDGAG